ncbi:TEA-domain-containing protein [Cystobasidium minutum MCA 4210]|uniref:TEA-domain-containing protein n=1 Tax=Cystobasidium minutum MCA 4210 TaxID=1397322 RepID=UPI0034CD17C6|eukprot:jgi/Rhomi1/191114/estExt_fgenesh1_pg.C_70094
MDTLSSHHLDVLESRLTMDEASSPFDASNCSTDSITSGTHSQRTASESADDAAAASAFQEFVYTSPQPGLQLPSTPLSALRIKEKLQFSSPLSLSPLPPSPMNTGMGIGGLNFGPISPVSLNAPPPTPLGPLDMSMQQQQAGILSINTALTMPNVKQQDAFDYDQFLTAAAQPLSPARPLSACSMTNSLSSSSLSSLSTSASYGSSLASYASAYNAPPNTFPYNLACRPDSPAGSATSTAHPHQQQAVPAPMGLNPAHVNPGSLLLLSPTKSTATYPHLQTGLTPPPVGICHGQDGRAPSPISPIPSPTSASAAITLIGVGITPQQFIAANDAMRATTPQTPISATAALSLTESSVNASSGSTALPALPMESNVRASAKRRCEPSEAGNVTLDSDVPVPSSSSPSKRSNSGSPEKRSAVNSSGGSVKSLSKTEIWPDDVEAAFMEALTVIPKLGRRKVMINGKPCGRNELIADYIRRKTFKIRTRKQVSSHIQVLKNLKRNDEEFMNLVTENMDDIDSFPAALFQAGFHMAQLPCLKTDVTIPDFTLAGLPTLGQLAASPISLQQAMNGNPMLAGNHMAAPPHSAHSDVSFDNLQTSMPFPYYFAGMQQQQPNAQFAQEDTQAGNFFQNSHGMLGPALYDNEHQGATAV